MTVNFVEGLLERRCACSALPEDSEFEPRGGRSHGLERVWRLKGSEGVGFVILVDDNIKRLVRSSGARDTGLG